MKFRTRYPYLFSVQRTPDFEKQATGPKIPGQKEWMRWRRILWMIDMANRSENKPSQFYIDYLDLLKRERWKQYEEARWR